MTADAQRPEGYGTIKSSLHTKAGKRPSASSDRTIEVGELEEHETMYNSWRHTLGILCLSTTVVLWTASNFLASDLLADNSYKKPYFLTYINTAFFIIPLIPIALVKLIRNPSSIHPILPQRRRSTSPQYASLTSSTRTSPERRRSSFNPFSSEGKLSPRATAKLALEFCLLWFLANYLVAACLSYTTVASATLLTSTSSIFTLLLSAAARIEPFTAPKLAGVLACLLGVALTTSSDWRTGGADDDTHRGAFPHKSPAELMLGNAMALASAACYGAYAVLLKARIGDERRVDMPLFFGLVGVWNVLLLWPGLVALHFTGVEPFELPPTVGPGGHHVIAVVLANGLSSLVSDITWAFAMLFTSPLLVTVGLSLTIPLSLVGQIVLLRQYASPVYWVGALVVVCSFAFINSVEAKEEAAAEAEAEAEAEAMLAPQPDEEADAERER